MVETKCPYCKRMMENICMCGAYKVSEESHNLPLKKQLYHDKKKYK